MGAKTSWGFECQRKVPLDPSQIVGIEGLQRARLGASWSSEDTKVLLSLQKKEKNPLVEEVLCPQASSDFTKTAELSSARAQSINNEFYSSLK